MLPGDKVLAKRILSFHGICTPEFAAIHRGALETADSLHFPVIVKPPQEDASIGIGAGLPYEVLIERIIELAVGRYVR